MVHPMRGGQIRKNLHSADWLWHLRPDNRSRYLLELKREMVGHTQLMGETYFRWCRLVLSICSLDWEWNPDDSVALFSLQKAFQNYEINCGPWSDTMSLGRQNEAGTLSINCSDESLSGGSLGREAKCADFEKQSPTVKMQVFLSDKSRQLRSLRRCKTNNGRHR